VTGWYTSWTGTGKEDLIENEDDKEDWTEGGWEVDGKDDGGTRKEDWTEGGWEVVGKDDGGTCAVDGKDVEGDGEKDGTKGTAVVESFLTVASNGRASMDRRLSVLWRCLAVVDLRRGRGCIVD
jgi:hypothetical protein